VEGALCHLGEHFGHGIGPIFALHFGVGHDLQAVAGELVAKEIVGEVDLTEDVDKVEDLAEKEADGVEAVGPPMEAPVFDNVINLSLLLLAGDEWLLIGIYKKISKTYVKYLTEFVLFVFVL
jgi:hypothetical protein